MKEYLFRGKDEYGNWIEGSLYEEDGMNTIVYPKDGSCPSNNGDCFVLRDTVGQYTNLDDHEGTKIFEGDVVGFAGLLYTIIFEAGSFMCQHQDIKLLLGEYHDGCIVVGNIYDNSELVKCQNI